MSSLKATQQDGVARTLILQTLVTDIWFNFGISVLHPDIMVKMLVQDFDLRIGAQQLNSSTLMNPC